MTHEISQFDLKHQPLSSGMRPNKNIWTDIGEAQVAYTMSGRAKVRITRKRDRVRRALLLAGVVVSAALAAIQQGWISIQQAELQQSAVTKFGWSIAEPIKSLAAQPASAFHLDAAPAARGKPAMPPQPEIRNVSVAQKGALPQQPIKAPEAVAAKPVVSQYLPANKPQAASTTATHTVAETTAATTAAVPPAYKAPAATSSVPNIPPITKAAPSGQEAASSSTADIPSTIETPPSRLIMTSRSAAVVPRILEPLPVQ
ncbi:MAG: hypothetical protein OEV35_08330 [Gallionellaceae bacterium]|nr:hypothetical protein [Gallionellaceae bacterium]